MDAIQNARKQIDDVYDQAGETFEGFFAPVRVYVKSAFFFLLVIIDAVSYTKWYERVKTVIIFSISFLFFTSIAILIGKSPPQHPDVGLTLFQFCEKYNYSLEAVDLTTEDGYVITVHRIRCPRYKKSCPDQRPVVLMMHGITGSSADFIVQGVGKSLAFQLVDQGFDVWIGNQRGNFYSRRHIMLDADFDQSFWDFSYHEIGLYDLPAMIDHVIKTTNQTKLTYVGLSQGCTAYLPLFNFFEIHEILRRDHITSQLLAYLCVGPHKIANWICTKQVGKILSGMNGDEIDYDIFPNTFYNYPSGTSVKQLLHFLQSKISGNFSHYNYYDQNPIIYNSLTPPLYDISKSTAPVAVYFSRGDDFLNVETLYNELKKMPNVVLKYKVPNDNFNHADFILNRDINKLLYNKVIGIIKKYN
ncbi:lipase 1-like isoform X2 [Rhynchophorus ferrugineus]|uniref:lipase 1-like isoform X2 n=1 Tax=Rhynchophorus ferrugineus TaxID=354439 RepID=UPI003FCE9B81